MRSSRAIGGLVLLLLQSACDGESSTGAGAVDAESDASSLDAASLDASPTDASSDDAPGDATNDAGPPRAGSMYEASAQRRGESVDMEELYWNPQAFDAVYPAGGMGPYVRAFAPPCRDGSNPADRQCSDGQPVRCADGTRPVYHFRRGTTNRWIIRVQNGGVACTVNYAPRDISRLIPNCWSAYEYGESGERLAFSSAGSRERAFLDGIYREAPASPFMHYNIVLLDKCVGDRNLGDATATDYIYRDERVDGAPVVEHVGPVYFHGFRVLEAILRGIASNPGSPPFDFVAFQTHSNGSNGQYMYLDRLAEIVRDIRPQAEVRGIATGMIRSSLEVEATADASGATRFDMAYDSLATYLDLEFHLRTSPESLSRGMWVSPWLYRDGAEHMRNDAWGTIDGTPTVDASCLAAHTGDISPCLDHMHVLLNHISTPMFLIAQQRDMPVLQTQHTFSTSFDRTNGCDPGAKCCHDENYPATEDCETFPGAPFFPVPRVQYDADDFADRVRSTVRALHEGMASRSELRPGCTGGPCDDSGLPSPPHGAFIDDTDDHFSVQQPERAGARIDGRTMAEYLYDWLETGTPTWCVDVSDGHVATSGTGAAWGICPP